MESGQQLTSPGEVENIQDGLGLSEALPDGQTAAPTSRGMEPLLEDTSVDSARLACNPRSPINRL